MINNFLHRFLIEYQPNDSVAIVFIALSFYFLIFYGLGAIIQKRYRLFPSNVYLTFSIGFIVYIIVTFASYLIPIGMITLFGSDSGSVQILFYVEIIKNIGVIAYIIINNRSFRENTNFRKWNWRVAPASIALFATGYFVYLSISGSTWFSGIFDSFESDSDFYVNLVNDEIYNLSIYPSSQTLIDGLQVILDPNQINAESFTYQSIYANLFMSSTHWVSITCLSWDLEASTFSYWFFSLITYTTLFAASLQMSKFFSRNNGYLESFLAMAMALVIRAFIFQSVFYSPTSIAVPFVFLQVVVLTFYFQGHSMRNDYLSFALWIGFALATFFVACFIIMIAFFFVMMVTQLINRRPVLWTSNRMLILLMIMAIVYSAGAIQIDTQTFEIIYGRFQTFIWILFVIFLIIAYSLFYGLMMVPSRKADVERAIAADAKEVTLGIMITIFSLGAIILILVDNSFILSNGFLAYGNQFITILNDTYNNTYTSLPIVYLLIVDAFLLFPYLITRINGTQTLKMRGLFTFNFLMFVLVLNPISINLYYFFFGDQINLLIVYSVVLLIPTIQELSFNVIKIKNVNRAYRANIAISVIAATFLLVAIPTQIVVAKKSFIDNQRHDQQLVDELAVNIASRGMMGIATDDDPDTSDYRYIVGDISNVYTNSYYYDVQFENFVYENDDGDEVPILSPIDPSKGCIANTCLPIYSNNAGIASSFYFDNYYQKQLDRQTLELLDENLDSGATLVTSGGVMKTQFDLYIVKLNSNIDDELLNESEQINSINSQDQSTGFEIVDLSTEPLDLKEPVSPKNSFAKFDISVFYYNHE